MATDTITRTPKGGLGGRVPPGAGGSRGVVPPASRVTTPRHTRPVSAPGTRPAPGTAGPRSRSRAPRMPFILLLVGLLGGALVSLLVISTTLAQGSFRITNLQEQNAELARQAQSLTNQVAQAGSPSVIAKEARQLGMRPNPHLGFIDPKTGRIIVGKPSRAEAAISVPGNTP